MPITIPNTFTANTVISSNEVDENFAELGAKALNRTGDTITGNIAVDSAVTIDGRDISADLDQAVKTTSTPTFAGVTISGTGASALDVAGGINAGSGNVGIVDTTGKIPAISSTYFASLSGANITSIAETNITDGTTLARLASNETVSGTWTFTPGIKERARSTAIGEWIDVSYAAGNFTASSGNWTVDSGDQILFRYTLIGKTMIVTWFIQSTDVSATPGSLRITIPDGFTLAASYRASGTIHYSDAGGSLTEGSCRVSSADGDFIQLLKTETAAAWSTTSSDDTSVRGTIIIEVA